MKKLLSITAALILMIFMLMYQSGAFETGKIDPGYTGLAFDIPKDHRIEKSERISVAKIYEESGIVSTKIKANISPQIMGTILTVDVEEGQKIKKDDIIATISSEQMGAKVEQVEKSLIQAKTAKAQANEKRLAGKAAFEQAEKNYYRVKDYYSKNAASAVALEDAKSKFEQAQAMYRAAEQGMKFADAEIQKAEKFLEEAKIGMGYSSIKAPFSGVVTIRHMDPGDMALPGKPIVTLNNMDNILIEINVREKLKDFIKDNMNLDVIIAEKKYAGIVEEIVPRVDPVTRTFAVKIGFDPDNEVFVGTYGKVLIPGEMTEKIIVPEYAIKNVGQMNTVLVKDNNKAFRIYVKPGYYSYNSKREILSGLSGNEDLVIQGE